MAMLKALVVDDASFVRDLVKRTVRQRFPVIETTDAQNGRRAQSLMSRTTFDLILCDWEMPEMSGLELLQWMRQQPQYEKVPFIMIIFARITKSFFKKLYFIRKLVCQFYTLLQL